MYRYALPTVVILVLTIWMAHIGTAGASGAESSSPDTAVHSLRSGLDAEQILTALCPVEQAVDTKKMRCRGCPDEASGDDGVLRLRRVYRGHFSGSSSPEAVVSLRGCAGDSSTGHSTAFFRHTKNGWQQVDYQPDLNTSSCRSSVVDDQPVLICRNFQITREANETDIFSLRHTNGQWHNTELAKLFDRSGKCADPGEFLRRLKSIHTGDLTDSSTDAVALLVESHRKTPNTDEPNRCEKADFDLQKSYDLEVFHPAKDGFESVELDNICSYEPRVQILNSKAPNLCSR